MDRKKLLVLGLLLSVFFISPVLASTTHTIDNFDVNRGTQGGLFGEWGTSPPDWFYLEVEGGGSSQVSSGTGVCFGAFEATFTNDDFAQQQIRSTLDSSGDPLNDLYDTLDEGDQFTFFIETESTNENVTVALEDLEGTFLVGNDKIINEGSCIQHTWNFPVDFSRDDWEDLNLNDINRSRIIIEDFGGSDEDVTIDLWRFVEDVISDTAREPFFSGPLPTCTVSNATCIVNSTGDSINGTTITSDLNQFKIEVTDTHGHIEDARAYLQSDPAVEDGSPTEQGTDCHIGINNPCNYTFLIDLSTADPGWVLIDFNFSDHMYDWTKDESGSVNENHRINSAGSSGTQDTENILWLFKPSAGGGSSNLTTSALNKIYISGSQNDLIYKYERSGVYNGENFSNTEGVSGGTRGMCYDGNNFWVVDDGANKLFEYTELGIPTGISISVNALDSLPTSLWCNSTHFVLAGDSSDSIFVLDSSGNLLSSFSVASEGGFPDGVTMKRDQFYVYHRSDNSVKVYDQSGVFNGASFDTSMQDSLGGGIDWDGTNFWLVGDETDTIYKYDISWSYTGISFDVSSEDNLLQGITNTGGDPIIPLFVDGSTFSDNTVIGFGARYTSNLLWAEKTMGLSLDNVTGNLIRQSFLPQGEILLFIENTKNLPSTFFLGFGGDGFDPLGPPIQLSPDTIIVQYFINKDPLNQCIFVSLADFETGVLVPDRYLPEINIYHENGSFINSTDSSRAVFCGLNDAITYDLTAFARGYTYVGESNVSVNDVVIMEIGGFSLTSRIFMTVFDNATDIGNLLEGAKIEFDTGGPFFTGPVGTTQFDLIRDRPTTVTITLVGFQTERITITPFDEFHEVAVAMEPSSGQITDTFQAPDPESFIESVRLVIWVLFWLAAFATGGMLLSFIFALFKPSGRPIKL